MQRTAMVLPFCLFILFVSGVSAPGQSQNATLSGTEDWIKGAENGNDILQHEWAKAYQEGRWICENQEEALKRHRRAAKQGNLEAQFALGSRYLMAQGTTPDYIQACMWLDRCPAGSVDKPNKGAAEIRDSAAEKLTPERVAEARRLASEWVTGYA